MAQGRFGQVGIIPCRLFLRTTGHREILGGMPISMLLLLMLVCRLSPRSPTRVMQGSHKMVFLLRVAIFQIHREPIPSSPWNGVSLRSRASVEECAKSWPQVVFGVIRITILMKAWLGVKLALMTAVGRMELLRLGLVV